MLAVEPASSSRSELIRAAFVLEWLTLAWVLVEAAVGLWTGWRAHSISLIAFGADSVIEALSAGVLIWRLSTELKHGQQFSEEAERRASRLAGALLFALAAYIIASAAWGLWTREGQAFTPVGLLITAATIPIMYVLARRKLTIAEQIGSRALRADAMEAITCGWLSFVVVAGLVAQWAIGAWWIDPVTSLAIVYLLVKEGREAWSAEECSCSSCH